MSRESELCLRHADVNKDKTDTAYLGLHPNGWCHLNAHSYAFSICLKRRHGGAYGLATMWLVLCACINSLITSG